MREITVHLPAEFKPYQGTSGHPDLGATLRVIKENVASPTREGCLFLICTDGNFNNNTVSQIEKGDYLTEDDYRKLTEVGETFHLNRWSFTTHSGKRAVPLPPHAGRVKQKAKK
jgi:hypothetical protein